MSDVNAVIDGVVGSPALLAALLLVTPTLIWIAYRLMFGRPRRMPDSVIGYLWVCQVCHSANPPAEASCYGCGNRMDRFETIQLVDAVTGQVIQSMPDGAPVSVPAMEPAGASASSAIAVGPGRPAETVIPLGAGAGVPAGVPVAAAPVPATPVVSATKHVPPPRSMSAVGARRPHEVGSAKPE